MMFVEMTNSHTLTVRPELVLQEDFLRGVEGRIDHAVRPFMVRQAHHERQMDSREVLQSSLDAKGDHG